MGNLVGIYHLLAKAQLWYLAPLLWILSDGAIHFLRDKLEGLGYQTAFSAKYGDAALITAILLATTILQRGDAHVPETLNAVLVQKYLLIACFAAGVIVCVLSLRKRSGRWGDIYHDVIIAPMILFSAVTLIPVIWYNAYWYEGLVVVIATIVWAGLIYIDIKHGRFNQRQWLVRHGIAIKGEVLAN